MQNKCLFLTKRFSCSGCTLFIVTNCQNRVVFFFFSKDSKGLCRLTMFILLTSFWPPENIQPCRNVRKLARPHKVASTADYDWVGHVATLYVSTTCTRSENNWFLIPSAISYHRRCTITYLSDLRDVFVYILLWQRSAISSLLQVLQVSQWLVGYSAHKAVPNKRLLHVTEVARFAQSSQRTCVLVPRFTLLVQSSEEVSQSDGLGNLWLVRRDISMFWGSHFPWGTKPTAR
jgi:hypothetical protein